MVAQTESTRRGFLGAFTAASYARVLGANDRVGLGFIGYGLIGARHVEDFKKLQDADLVAVADTYRPRVEQGAAACGGNAKGYSDFRKLLDDKDVDAVVISTPDHWHALQTMLACAAGKDVYVEKPMTLFAAEGRWMTDGRAAVSARRPGGHAAAQREALSGRAAAGSNPATSAKSTASASARSVT